MKQENISSSTSLQKYNYIDEVVNVFLCIGKMDHYYI